MQRLVAAARRLFAERGPDSVSLRDVAGAAGVNLGLIHHYIGSRDDLVALVFETSAAETAEHLSEVRGISEAVTALRSMCDGSGDWTRLLAWTVLAGHPAVGTQARSTVVDTIVDAADHDSTELRTALAVTLLEILALDLFGDFVQAAVGLDDQDATTFRAGVHAAVDRVIEAAIDADHSSLGDGSASRRQPAPPTGH